MKFLRQGATHKVVLGPAVAVGDGFTPVTTLALSSADEAEAILHDNGTVVDISGYTWAAITTADGYYHLTLQSGISNTVGHMTVVVNDDSLCLPLREDFTILEEAVYDALFASSANGFTGAAGSSKVAATIAAGDIANDAITADALATAAVEELRNAITGGAYPLDTDANGRMRIVDGTGAGELDTASGRVLANTDQIEGAGAIDTLDARIDARLAAIHLDHLFAVADPGGAVANNSFWAKLLSKSATAAYSDFNNQDDSLQAISDRVSGLPTAGTIAATVWTEDVSGYAADTAGALLFNAEAAATTASAGVSALRDTLVSASGTVTDLSATSTSFDTNLAADVWADHLIVFASGALEGQAKPILSIVDGVITVSEAFSQAPAFGDTFYVAAAHIHPTTQIADAVWAAGTRTLTALGFDLASGDFASNWLTADGAATDFIQEVRNAITGGAYALDTDANGAIRIVDGTGARELDTASGLVKISGILQTLDALDTAQDAEHDATQAAIAALSIPTVAQILTTQMTESYAANGVAPTLAQAMFAIHQKLMQHAYSGTSSPVYRLDNTTVAFTGTLNDATNPTSDRRVA